MDTEQLKEGMRTKWGRGNYAPIAELLMPASEAVARTCGISEGQQVLDVAAGNGNLALLAARAGARVVASDISPGQVELGRERTEAEGHDVEWLEADAENLPFEDGRFDCAASVFGAMFAPNPERAAAELFRVVRPGGTVGMANWVPAGMSRRISELNADFGLAPEGARPGQLWGDEALVRERFAALAAEVRFDRDSVPYRFESPSEAWSFFVTNSPILAAAPDELGPQRYDELERTYLDLFTSYADGPDGPVASDSEYLLVVARKSDG